MAIPHRWRRGATAVVGVVVCLSVAYLAGMSLLLGTRLLRATVSEDPDSFLLDYASAYSIVPGHVHVEGLTIRGAGRHVQWFLTIDRGDIVVSFTDLLRKRFHASRVRVNAVTIRVRFRIDPALATPELLASLPAIAGLADPPYADFGPEPPPVTDAHDDRWTVQLEDVDVEHAREVWVQMARAQSDSRVRGRWIFRPARRLEVGPAIIDVNALEFSYGERKIASRVHGTILGTLHPFDLRESGLGALDHVSTDGHVDGVVMTANTIAAFVRSTEVQFAGGEGPIDARIIIDHGVFVRGTHASIEATGMDVAARGMSFSGVTRIKLDVQDSVSPPGPIVSVDAILSNVRVSSGGAALGDVASADARLTGRRPELQHAFDDATFSVVVNGAQTKSLSLWAARFAPTSPVALGSGQATASAHIDGSLAQRRARGACDFAIPRMSVKRGSESLTTDVTGRIDVREASLEDKTIDVGEFRVVLENTDAASHEVHLAAPRIALQTTRLFVTLPTATFEGDGTIVGNDVAAGPAHGAVLSVSSLSVVASRLTFAPAGTTGRISIDVPGAAISDIRGLAQVLRLPPDVEFDGGRVDAKGHVDMDLAAGSALGDGEIIGRSIRARFGTTTVASDLTAELKARRAGSVQSGLIDLSGSTVAITNGSTERGGGPWWGAFALSNAILQTTGGVSFRANVSGTGKDASPAAVLIADNTATPAWAANIFRMPNLRTQAEIRATPSSIEVRSLVARGEGASIRMEYAQRGSRHEGALLLDVGWVEMGYDLTQDSTGPVMLGSEGWFAKKTTMIREHALPLN